jgi:hypothetical protein
MTEVPFSPFLQRCWAAFESASDLFFVLDLASGGDLFYHLAAKVSPASAERASKSQQNCKGLSMRHLN